MHGTRFASRRLPPAAYAANMMFAAYDRTTSHALSRTDEMLPGQTRFILDIFPRQII